MAPGGALKIRMARVSPEEQAREFTAAAHPFNIITSRVAASLTPDTQLLDLGCGRDAVRLRRLAAQAGHGFGIDVDEFTPGALADPTVTLVRVTGDRWALPDASIDLAYSVSVFEHLEFPERVLGELRRVMRPGATVHVLTPNRWDYVSLAASLIPNALHPWIVKQTEGRDAVDTFPTFYRANTRSSLARVATEAGFVVEHIDYRGWAPSYLSFSRTTFRLGAWYQRAIERFEATQWLQGWLLATLRVPGAVPSASSHEPKAAAR
jgi:SAM-dependent methyltransferase